MNKIILLLWAMLFVACAGSSSDKNSDENTEVILIRKTSEYVLIPDSSEVTWNRYLNQKPTKQNVQIFGFSVEADLGEVEMTTSGTANVRSGNLILIDFNPVEALIIFDMQSFKLAKEKGKGLFDVKNYPECSLHIKSFEEQGDAYLVSSELTIENTTKETQFELNVTENVDKIVLSGSFKINTLDYPLRDNVTAADVNQDVITINFVIPFTLFQETTEKISNGEVIETETTSID